MALVLFYSGAVRQKLKSKLRSIFQFMHRIKLTKTKIDRAGIALSKNNFRSEEELLELEGVFDEYRKSHLQPLSETTIELQNWLNAYGGS